MKFVYAQTNGVTRCLTDDASLKKIRATDLKTRNWVKGMRVW